MAETRASGGSVREHDSPAPAQPAVAQAKSQQQGQRHDLPDCDRERIRRTRE